MTSTNENRMSCKLGVLSRPDGSALLHQGNTAIIAGVYAPVEARIQKVLIDKASIEAYYRPKSGQPSVGDRLYESIITNMCETALLTALYPRSAVMVIIQEMQNGGELLACAINAASLALLEAGIDLKFLVGAVSCALDKDRKLHVNCLPSQDEPSATFLFAFDSVEKNVLASHTTGSFTSDEFRLALDVCKKQCDQVFDFLRTSISSLIK